MSTAINLIYYPVLNMAILGENNDLKYWVGFSVLQKLDPIKFRQLIDYFGTLAQAWQADLIQLKLAGIEEKLAHEIIKAKNEINLDQECDKITKEDIKLCRLIDNDYPPLLKEIFDPPPLLYYRGSLKNLNQPCLAVVGARKFTNYGQQVADEIVSELAQSGLTIISGLALGIDALSHRACLKHHGKTVGVLGSGVNKTSVYPVTNQRLGEEIIASGGCLISEYPINTPGLPHHFPARNRIIAGLSLGTLVIEARERSGSLITARLALEQNRSVFAVPGSIYNRNSVGTNNLIKLGAKPVTVASDILEEFDLQQVIDTIKPDIIKPETETEKTIIAILSKEPIFIDQIAQRSGLAVNQLLSNLMTMELKGMIKDLGGKNYIKR